MKLRYGFIRNSIGNVAIEFALVLPFIFLLLSGIINFGLILANQNQLNDVVSAGMLDAFGNSASPSAVQNAMQNATSISPLTVTATQFCQCLNGTTQACTQTCSDGSTPGTYMTVTAQSQVSLIALDFVLTNPFVINAQGTIRTN
jgi:Flp pilus assembly protein TadG